MVIHAAMSVTMHDHIHLGSASHAGIGVGTIDAVVGKMIHAAAGFLGIKLTVQRSLHGVYFLDDRTLFLWAF